MLNTLAILLLLKNDLSRIYNPFNDSVQPFFVLFAAYISTEKNTSVFPKQVKPLWNNLQNKPSFSSFFFSLNSTKSMGWSIGFSPNF